MFLCLKNLKASILVLTTSCKYLHWDWLDKMEMPVLKQWTGHKSPFFVEKINTLNGCTIISLYCSFNVQMSRGKGPQMKFIKKVTLS